MKNATALFALAVYLTAVHISCSAVFAADAAGGGMVELMLPGLGENVEPHPAAALSFSNQAGRLREQGRHAEAETLYLRALTNWEQTLGKEHPAAAMGLSNLAELYREQHRHKEAEALHRRAVTIWENALGKEHPSVGFGLHKLALAQEAQGRLAEAGQLCRRAMAILKKQVIAGNPKVEDAEKDCARIKRKK